jgi:MOSC domain-containing protein YiiM
VKYDVLSVLTGNIDRSFSPRGSSAIGKSPQLGPVSIGHLGLAGDEQADHSVHGGLDKAIHHYPADHYAFWRALISGQPLLDSPGAFGENISTRGMVEGEVCIGDRYRLGSAVVEVSQGRQPCWKQGHRLGDPFVVSRMVDYRFSGWYYRVIEPGDVKCGDTIELLERPHPLWNVHRTFGLLIGKDGKDYPAALRALADMPVLASPWRLKALALLDLFD